MNQALFYASTLAFLAVPPCALLAKFRMGRRFSWWVLVPFLAFCGWLFINVRVHFYFEHLCEPFGEGTWDVPAHLQDQFQRCIGDGGQRTFALFFGWLAALIYSVPFFVAYAITASVRARRRPTTHAA